MDEKDKEIEKLKKDLKFVNDQLAKTLQLYDNAKAETEKAVSARSELLSKLSHEAKTPMNALIGYSDLIHQEDVSGEFFDFAMGIKSATNRLLNFFNDLIELSRIESGMTTLIEEEYKLADSIKYVINNVRYDIESKGIELRFKIGENVPTSFRGDKVHIHQIVLNLINNAIKFTDKGYIAVEIDAKNTDKIGKNGGKMMELSFAVEDTGKGIKKADREKLFQAFTQFNSSSPYANQGAGLGLIICKYFSNLMNGDITFDSKYGKGSRFVCTVLQEVVDETALDTKFVADYVYNSDMKLSAPEAKVLLVDDSKVNLSVASGLLKWFDIDAVTAGGGLEAVEKAETTQFDIIFMDHMMPDMDGVEATGIIRGQNKHNKEVPIIALTANTTDEARIMFRENGFNDFLAKPVEIDSFKAMLERWLPYDKIVRDTKSNAAKSAQKANDSIDKAEFERNGIVVNKGLVYFAGKMSAYIDTLKLVYKEGLENIGKLKKFYESGDLGNYGILAHSIKSVMASIGAMEISEFAKSNELEAKAGNAEYIKANGEQFIEDYTKVINFIGANVDIENSTNKQGAEAGLSESAGTGAGIGLGEGGVASVAVDVDSVKKLIEEAIADIEDFESDAAIEKLKKVVDNCLTV